MEDKEEIIKRIARLSPKRRDALDRLLRNERVSSSRLPIIPHRRGVSNTFPLSYAQLRMWFLAQLEPDNPFYNESSNFRFTGWLNVGALERSLTEIVRRHEALRTTFTMVDGQPVQVIAPTSTVTLQVVDLQHLSRGEQSAEVGHLATEEAQRPFDLSNGPLLRVTLLQLGEESYVLLLTMHHIISDGWSTGIFIREFAALYQAFSKGGASSLPELPIQYADFAVWQRQWLTGEMLETQLNYWKEQLAEAPPLLSLPTDRPRLPVQTFRGSTKDFQLNADLTRKLKILSQHSGTTLFMTLLAALTTLLSRYSGQDDIVVGSPIANRNRREIEPIIGFFVNTLVLRIHLQGNPSFSEFLTWVRQVVLDAYTHQDVPFEQVVEALQPERSLSYTPLFQVMFVLQNAPTGRLELPDLTLTTLEMESVTAKFDLILSMEETEQGLRGTWEYNKDLFDVTTITRMVGHFQTLLEGIVVDPQRQVAELPLLTGGERHQLLVAWNDTLVDYPQDKCIHELFEAQVEQTPDSVAVVFEYQQLTYRELNARANQLGHYLQTLGVGPEVLVGICLERSLEMVIGLLGILKAGGAYVPLDPNYPHQRLGFMLSDAQVSVLLTQTQLLSKFPEHSGRVVCWDTDWRVIAQKSQENPVSGVKPFNLAYVIYTSGSTGQPKGTIIVHQGLVNYLSWCTKAYAVADGDGAPVHSSIGFDATITGLFSPLLVGQSVVLLPEKQEIQALCDILRSQSHFSLVKLTPAHLDLLSRLLLPKEAMGKSRALIVGGETLFRKSLSFWQTYAPQTRLVNEYGPTETVVGCCVYEVSAQTSCAGAIPIGRPIANTQLYLLDRSLQPVAIGVPGELHIGGDGLARGYLHRPDLTAEKFIPNPFSQQPGACLYKTGDLACYRSDGTIEYLGRIDHQVKVRGFRIELGEIEAVLSQHPEVRETVVVVRENMHGDKRLVAYVVAKQQPVPSISDLHRFLKEKLPDYMVPSVFLQLEALPLTTNGKLDRRALPAPDTTRPELDKEFVAPRTALEDKLTDIWAKVLSVEQVGIRDNFFELGGDSILAIQIIARAKQAGLQLTPKQLFQYQTISELAAVAGTTSVIQAEQGLVMGSVPLTPIQHWFFEQNLLHPTHFNQSLLFEVPPDLKPELLEQVVQKLLVHHDALRLRFVPSTSGWQQVNAASDKTVPFTVVNLSAVLESEQGLAIEQAAAELQASLHLSEGPVIRVALFYLGIDKPGRLLLIVHHLVVDGISWQILLEDLATSYQQLSRGSDIQLPPKSTSFKNWSERLNLYGQSEALASEMGYWLAQSLSAVAPLPVDYPSDKNANTIASAAQVSISLSVDQTRTLLQEVSSAYNTQINDVLLTALMQSFAQWTRERSLLFDLEGHGREELFEDVNLTRTVGCFTAQFPILLKLEEVDHPGEVLKSVKEQFRRLPKRGIGYGLMRYLSWDAAKRLQLQTLPRAEVRFQYLGQWDQVWAESPLLRFAKESSGSVYSPLGTRSHLLEVNGFVASGRLQLDWIYSENIHQRATVESLAQGFMEALKSLIAHCQSAEAGYTPSDFSGARLSQKQLDKFIAKIKQTSRR